MERIGPSNSDKLIFLGDYIDRGPDSMGVIDRLIKWKDEGLDILTLRGNHEEILLQLLTDPEEQGNWMFFGGKETLESFKIEQPYELDWKYIDWLQRLLHYTEVDSYILAHAGINFEAEKPFEDFYNMLWIRHYVPTAEQLAGRKVVHGHTPITVSELEINLRRQWPIIDLDTGCVYSGRKGMGFLSALELGTEELVSVNNQEGRVSIYP
jgi:serine/threonine protein phosphatase 1